MLKQFEPENWQDPKIPKPLQSLTSDRKTVQCFAEGFPLNLRSEAGDVTYQDAMSVPPGTRGGATQKNNINHEITHPRASMVFIGFWNSFGNDH